jgi:hypothetical protein
VSQRAGDPEAPASSVLAGATHTVCHAPTVNADLWRYSTILKPAHRVSETPLPQ